MSECSIVSFIEKVKSYEVGEMSRCANGAVEKLKKKQKKPSFNGIMTAMA